MHLSIPHFKTKLYRVEKCVFTMRQSYHFYDQTLQQAGPPAIHLKRVGMSTVLLIYPVRQAETLALHRGSVCILELTLQGKGCGQYQVSKLIV